MIGSTLIDTIFRDKDNLSVIDVFSGEAQGANMQGLRCRQPLYGVGETGERSRLAPSASRKRMEIIERLSKRRLIMKSSEILNDIDATLDRLIQNSCMLNQISTEDEAIALQKTQDDLLDHLLRMDNLLDDEEKQVVLQQNRPLYGSLEEKIRRFSTLNIRSLRPKKERWVKKARVHRNRNKLV